MSIEVGVSERRDVPALRALWKQAFGDTDAVIGGYFDRFYHPDDVFVLREDGKVRSMAMWWRETLCCGMRGWSAA